MAEELTQVNFRMPTSLKQRLEEAASADNRSLTSEIVARLDESFAVPDMKQAFSLAQEVADIRAETIKLMQERNAAVIEANEYLKKANNIQERTIKARETTLMAIGSYALILATCIQEASKGNSEPLDYQINHYKNNADRYEYLVKTLDKISSDLANTDK